MPPLFTYPVSAKQAIKVTNHLVRRGASCFICVTIHQVTKGFDEGDIAIQKIIKTRHCVNKVELAYRLALLGGESFVELIQTIEKGALELKPQQEADASYYGFPE